MRAILAGLMLLPLGLLAPALAGDNAPVIVVPTRPDVPVIIDGRDASWSVVEGDVGLYRPGHLHPTVIGGRLLGPAWVPRGYYPATGRPPRYGRLEIEPPPNRPLPPRAEPYYRAWGAQSDPVPASVDPVPHNSPTVILAPRAERHRHWGPRRLRH